MTVWFSLCAAAKSLQSCPTLCDPIDGSPPDSPVPGILQARILEWVAISFSNAWKWKVKAKSLSRVRLLATPWTAAHQAPPSVGFSRQEYWSGVPLFSDNEFKMKSVVIAARKCAAAAQNRLSWMLWGLSSCQRSKNKWKEFSVKCKGVIVMNICGNLSWG